ncbi:hypothetical protein Harman_11510 [Haloarcula mannanilytica]|uniref:Uncharacterized protein n=2 Tax=Haloarcula mannanilytica TaxID=2509225 RepID=A0A4C2EFG6_9EURY|nr:hypothetical protein Harman_11510 [Haloarcula mannanilytica]
MRSADATFTLARADSADEEVIAEQVMASGRFAAYNGEFRNAYPFLSGNVHRVVIETGERTVDGVLGDDTNSR